MVSSRSLRRPALAAAASTLVLLAMTGCGPDRQGMPDLPSEPAGPPTSAGATPSTSPTTPPTSPPSSSNTPEAVLRTKLADALQTEDPASAGAVTNPSTKLTVVDAGWLPGWQVVDVDVRSMPHPQRFYVGLSTQGQARYLTGKPENFDAMVTDARIRVTATTAVALGRTFLDTTRTFQRYSYRVEEVGAIEWRSGLSPAEQQVRDQVEKTYTHDISAPRATPAGDGWTVTAWMVDGTTLVRHDLAIAQNGATTDHPEVVARDLPVPASV